MTRPQLTVFARHLVSLLQQARTDELPAAFAVVERLHAEGSPDVQEAATIGLLEDVQTLAQNAGIDPSSFEPFLGPISRQWWIQLNEFWAGKIGYVGETYRQPNGEAKPTSHQP